MKFTDKLKATWQFYSSLGNVAPIDIYNEDILRASLVKNLEKYGFNIPANELLIEDVVDSAIKTAKGLDENTNFERVAYNFSPILKGAIQKTALACGISGIWEMNLKFFAGKIEGIEVLEENKKLGQLRTVNVGPLAKKIKKKMPKLKADIEFIADLRNNFFHGNFHQVRRCLERKLPPEKLSQLNSKIAILNLKATSDSDRIKMSDEVTEIDKAKKMGVFFWFLAGGNSKLIDLAIDSISLGIVHLEILTGFQANSFEETDYFFEQLSVHGNKLSSEEEELYFKLRHHIIGVPLNQKRKYFDTLYSLFELT